MATHGTVETVKFERKQRQGTPAELDPIYMAGLIRERAWDDITHGIGVLRTMEVSGDEILGWVVDVLRVG